MIELAQLFQDVEAAVVQQEPAVEEIETKAAVINDNVGKANHEIDGAIVKARSRNRKKWICLGLIGKHHTGFGALLQWLLTRNLSAPPYCYSSGCGPCDKAEIVCIFSFWPSSIHALLFMSHPVPHLDSVPFCGVHFQDSSGLILSPHAFRFSDSSGQKRRRNILVPICSI